MRRTGILLFLLSLILSLPACSKNNDDKITKKEKKDSFSYNRGLGGVASKIKTPEGKILDLYQGSYALVIGNGDYRNGWDSLKGAVQDAEEVAEALGRYGFEVTLETNLRREDFLQVLNEFSIKYGKSADSQLLIYYAGHGYTEKLANDEDLGYLVMVDTPLPEKDPVGFINKTVDMQVIVTKAKQILARHVLFMFDSCFSGTLLSMRDKVVPKSISDSVKYPVRQFITAGRANEPVPDHSFFKQAFLDLIEGRDREPIPDGYITGEELGLYLKNKVPEYNPAQHPQYGKIRDPKLNKGDFVFAFNTTTRWRSKEKALEEELKRIKAESKEAEAKFRVKKLEKEIKEARHKRKKAEEKTIETNKTVEEKEKSKSSLFESLANWFTKSPRQTQKKPVFNSAPPKSPSEILYERGYRKVTLQGPKYTLGPSGKIRFLLRYSNGPLYSAINGKIQNKLADNEWTDTSQPYPPQFWYKHIPGKPKPKAMFKLPE